MLLASFDVSAMYSGEGVAIAATGMLIVFAALILITLFISALPHMLKVVARVIPEAPDKHAPQDRSAGLLADEAVLAAIGFVLHTEVRKQVRTGGKPD